MRTMTYYIDRSGKLEQQYVLWLHTEISYGSYNIITEKGICNLGCDKSIAISNAQKHTNLILDALVERNGTIKTLEFCECHRRKLVPLHAFGTNFKATAKGYCADATKEFWDAWNLDKENVKAQGFRCFKTDEGFKIFISKNQVET